MRKELIEDLEDEIWIQDSGYEVSNKGRIIGKQGRLLKCKENYCGYLQCSVKFDDGFFARNVHRAVAHVFIPNPDNLPEVNHKDGVKTNNCVENLEWVTKQQNQKHEVEVLQKRNGEKNCRSNITNEQAIEIYHLCKEGKMLYKDIAKMYNIFPPEVSRIVLGTNWTCLGLPPLPPLVRGSRGKGRSNYKKEYIKKLKEIDKDKI
jgi:hypothetical protein